MAQGRDIQIGVEGDMDDGGNVCKKSSVPSLLERLTWPEKLFIKHAREPITLKKSVDVNEEVRRYEQAGMVGKARSSLVILGFWL